MPVIPDYVVWRKFNTTSTELPNDPNPVSIDNDQYNTWTTNFGDSGSGAGGGASDTAVPKPGALAVVLGGVALMMMRRSACYADSRIRRSK